MRTVSGTGFTGPGKRLADTSPGPWKAWKTRTRHGRAIRFIETYCRPPHGRGHGPTPQPDAAVLATPRGNGKSTFGGVDAIGECLLEPFLLEAGELERLPVTAALRRA